MFEKMCTRLFRLYPSKFRKEYEGEALQLIRDRLSDETGFFKRARLWWDLLLDVLAGLPQAYRNSYAATEAASISPNAKGIPSFNLLEEEPLGRGSILLGGALSLTIMIAFGFLLSRSIAHLPLTGGRVSPIEAVIKRLNRPTTPERVLSQAEDAFKSTAVGSDEREPRPWPAASLSKSNPPAWLQESKIPNEGSPYLAMQSVVPEASAWRGTLTDASGGPVRSAEIHLIGGNGDLVARTAADGSFAFSEPPSGNYEVVIVLGGRQVAHLKALHLSTVPSTSRLTLASGGRLLVSGSGN